MGGEGGGDWFRGEEFGSKGVQRLQGGKPLGFPNPRAKLSLGKKRKI